MHVQFVYSTPYVRNSEKYIQEADFPDQKATKGEESMYTHAFISMHYREKVYTSNYKRKLSKISIHQYNI